MLTYDPGSSGALSYLEAAREMALRGLPESVAIEFDPQFAEQHQEHNTHSMSEGIQ